MKPFFDADNPVEEASHWLSLLLFEARSSIDERFGSGFAEKNPALVGAYLSAGAKMISSKNLGSSLGDVAGALNELVFAIDRAEFFSTDITSETD